MIVNDSKNEPNEPKKYYCKICDYNTCKKSNYNRHLYSINHKKLANDSKMVVNDSKNELSEPNISNNLFTCDCGKIYKYDSGYYRHKKICNKLNFSTNKEEFIIELLKQNKELMELLKNGTNQIINNTMNNCHNNNNNKTFNLQVFLNETCKNAMNLSEFIKNMTVELPDLENMGKLGYVEGVSNIIIKNLKALEITQRPIHCSDEKRETVMIKENNVWFKEGDDRENLRKIVSTVISRNLVLLAEYEEKYPDCNKYDSHRSDEYTKIIMETATNQAEKKKEKIFRLIAREVVIDKSIL
jgi:hypothetical protein